MEYRTKSAIKIEPEGPEHAGAIQSFQLVHTVDHQRRRHERESWKSETDQYKRYVIAEGITRHQLAELIADGADWLAYEEGR